MGCRFIILCLRGSNSAHLGCEAYVNGKIRKLCIPNWLSAFYADHRGFHFVGKHRFRNATEICSSVYHTVLEAAQVTAVCELNIRLISILKKGGIVAWITGY